MARVYAAAHFANLCKKALVLFCFCRWFEFVPGELDDFLALGLFKFKDFTAEADCVFLGLCFFLFFSAFLGFFFFRLFLFAEGRAFVFKVAGEASSLFAAGRA